MGITDDNSSIHHRIVNMNQTTDYSDAQRVLMLNPQTALLDAFIPGFSLVSAGLQRYFLVDISLYVPALMVAGIVVFSFKYVFDYFGGIVLEYGTCSADIRVDDEMYNMLMSWVSQQSFAKQSRKFVASTNLNSRMWYLFDYNDNDAADNDDDGDDSGSGPRLKAGKEKKIAVTPSFGKHYFFYKRRLLFFSRTQNETQSYMPISEREEISVSCFGRDPTVLKDLLEECRLEFLKHDENKTLIYRGSLKSGSTEPTWTRCMSRVSRPFSTVVLDDEVKQALLEDMSDYLHPATKRWYSNRGIPYRRGYLLYGPPGTGKSSLSFAIAGHFRLKIYIVSLNSLAMNEENLGTLFAELPKQCVVLLEDIDTAGLTHTRQIPPPEPREDPEVVKKPNDPTRPPTPQPPSSNANGKISLSALLNVIDGVASQEGRVLIMTTNHLEKLDQALIRPGRVDMQVRFKLADTNMIATIFRGIFATIEGDVPRSSVKDISPPAQQKLSTEKEQAIIARLEAKAKEEELRIAAMAEVFATRIPSDNFSPAEIQGFLLKFKRDPEGAVEAVESWVLEMEERRKLEKQKTNIVENDTVEDEKKDGGETTAESQSEKLPETQTEGETLENCEVMMNDKEKDQSPEKLVNGIKEAGNGVDT